MGITFCLFAMPMLSNRMLDSDQDANEEIDGAIAGDVADSAISIEMTSKEEREMTSSFSMQRATDALLDYVTEN
jgi:hypothetical protein